MPDFRVPALTRRGVLGAAGAVAAAGAAAWTGSIALADSAGGKGHCEPNPATPKRQFRASWIATTANVDWPSKPGLDVDTQKAEYQRFLDEAKDYRLNAVVTQIRPTADAFWPSKHEPWSRWITGTQGKDPGYDPLGFAVDATHKAGLEFHAWLNPYRISMKASTGDVGTDVSKLADGHPAREHPEWVVAYPKKDGQLYYNPGIPEVRAFVIDAMMEAVDRYDIDAIHFDDYFYPYPVGDEDFDDADTFAKYGGDFSDIGDWRRDNTDQLIRGLGKRIKRSKPWVRFGISPFGVWRNKSSDPKGSDTTAGAETYSSLFADTRKWVRKDWIDYIAPQIYWAMSLEAASYKVLTQWWDDVCSGVDCQLFIGEATYKVGVDTASPEWKQDPKELLNHLTLDRKHPEIDGNIYFSATSVREDKLDAMTLLRDEHYTRPALVPASDHLGGKAPKAPRFVSLSHDGKKYTVRWKDASRRDGIDATKWYAIYAVSGKPDDCDLADAAHLVAVRPATGGTEEYSWSGDADPKLRVAITALNRVWQEGKPAIGEAS